MTDVLEAEKTNTPTSMIEWEWSSEHWLWRGPKTADAQPVVYLAGRQRLSVRRFVFELFNGPLKRSDRVRLACGRQSCIRPTHLAKEAKL